MENQAIITNEKWTDFCKHQERIETNLEILCRDVKEMKATLEKQKDDTNRRCDNLCELIGEVPQGKTVMQCVRDNSARMEKIWWGIIVVFAVIEFFANYPKLMSMFN
jgi:hypothetical protein